MKSKHLVSFLAIITGLNVSAKNAFADVIVEWQAGDNSANIQQAIDSGDSRVVIAQADEPWIIGQPLRATSPNQTILFEPGVTLKAQAGAFKGTLDSLVTITSDNVTLSGYRATLQMRKEDYADPNLYEPSPYRHLIRIKGALNFVVEGLTLKDSGGDGIIVSHSFRDDLSKPAERRFSSGIIRDVVADNNFRLGISVISAKNLLIKNSILKNANGIKPASGLDLEPEYDWQKLVNIRVQNTKFVNNDRNGVQIGLGKYRGPLVEDISVVFDNCTSIDNGEIGIKIQGVKTGFYDGSKGSITFNNLQVENSGWHGIWIRNDQTDPDQTYQFTFNNTKVINSATETGKFYPVTFWNTIAAGGITNVDFGNNFSIVDNQNRPGVFANNHAIRDGFTNISGTINIDNPQQLPPNLGENLTNFKLKFTN